MSRILSRRQFLHTAAGGTLALPLLTESSRPARAATAPKRLLICFTPNGTIQNAWLPKGTAQDFALGEIMAPLAPHKNDITVVENLTMTAALRAAGGDAHGLGVGCLLTGIEPLPGNQFAAGMGGPGSGWPGGISIDQFIAERIGKATRFPSLEFTVKTMEGNIWSRISYKGAAIPVTPMDNPSMAFDRVFGCDTGDAAALARLRAQRRSVLDNSLAEFEALGRTLGKVDRQKIESHLGGLRDLERQLAATCMPVGAQCTKPPRSTLVGTKVPKYNLSNEDADAGADVDIPARHDAIRQMVVAAFACDLTRVASVILAPSRSPIVMSWLGIKGMHHAISHTQDTASLIKIDQFYAQEIAKLIADLKASKEADGKSVFDNTLIVWCNELGIGSGHTHDKIPFMLAGSAGGYFKTGRLVTAQKGIAQNDLLVSIANAMGLSDVTMFGNPAYCKGPLVGLT